MHYCIDVVIFYFIQITKKTIKQNKKNKQEYIPEVIRVAINTFEMLRHSFPYTNHNQAKNTLLAMSQQQQGGSEGGGTGGTGGMRQTGRITSSGEGGFDVVSSLESSGFFGSRGSVESGPSSSSSSASSTSSSLTAVVSPYHVFLSFILLFFYSFILLFFYSLFFYSLFFILLFFILF